MLIVVIEFYGALKKVVRVEWRLNKKTAMESYDNFLRPLRVNESFLRWLTFSR